MNSKGPFRLSVLAAQRMRAAGGGAIVNVSSDATRHPDAPTLVYAMAKAGLECLTAVGGGLRADRSGQHRRAWTDRDGHVVVVEGKR